MQTLSQKAFVSGTAVQNKTRVAAKSVRSPVVVRAQKEEVSYDEMIYAAMIEILSKILLAMVTMKIYLFGNGCCYIIRHNSSKISYILMQAVDRRAALGLFAAAAALTGAQPSEAAYGDQARVFAGKVTNKSGKLKSEYITTTSPVRSVPDLASRTLIAIITYPYKFLMLHLSILCTIQSTSKFTFI